jgi:flagellar basal-body rod modification protein FlgD
MLQGITNNASSSTLPVSNQNAASLKNEFLHLLITQLKNQDPTKPMDNTQMVAQQAQFANLEQSQALNTQLTILLAQQNVSQATNLIGKNVTGVDNTGVTVAGQVLGVSFANGISALTVQLSSGAQAQLTLPNVTTVSL